MGTKKKLSVKLMLVWIYLIVFGLFYISGGLFLVKNDYASGKHMGIRLAQRLERYAAQSGTHPLRPVQVQEYNSRHQDLRREILKFQERKTNTINPLAWVLSVLGVGIGLAYVGSGIRLFQRSQQAKKFLVCGIGAVALDNVLKAVYLMAQRSELLPILRKFDDFTRLLIPESEHMAMSSLMEIYSSPRALFPVILILALYSLIFYVLLPLLFITRKGIKSQLT